MIPTKFISDYKNLIIRVVLINLKLQHFGNESIYMSIPKWRRQKAEDIVILFKTAALAITNFTREISCSSILNPSSNEAQMLKPTHLCLS
ncbi:hypothetical protein PIB30_094640 [Stylosanthes scabra]|uniref:Uncharacterized protein n=1 Tax=Stylosanthes scabra TaxID=79078 RepID=A0ABU6ZU89_9FABA|nr:hypothetical protein [Stylosanthes scabra]